MKLNRIIGPITESNTTLYHGTSKKLLPSIMRKGLLKHKTSDADPSVCAMSDLKKAKSVAKYFGEDGVVVVFSAPNANIRYHPDYGRSPEFDTIHVMDNVPPENIIDVVDAPGEPEHVRPAGKQLRTWKSKLSKLVQ